MTTTRAPLPFLTTNAPCSAGWTNYRPVGMLGGMSSNSTPNAAMAWELEVVVVPVSDVDRAKTFYSDRLGFHVDHDTVIDSDNRIVQLTPPGSSCSIVIGSGVVPDMTAGSLKGLQLVVSDIERADEMLTERGVETSGVQVLGENPMPTPHPLDNVGFVFFGDPDGNGWAVQQISGRAAK